MHEINNPLATIGACVVAMEGRLAELAPEARHVMLDYLGIIEKEVDRCTSILDGLLDFSRPVGRSKTAVDVNALMEDTLFLVQHHKGFRRLEVVRALGPDLPEVVANGGQILQVFMAIILNAIDAMPEGGTLQVRTASDGNGHVHAEFHDTGRGIARADLPKVFEPFFTTKAPGQGTGLGLSICYGIMQEHGGDITVDSEPGVGSVFRVTLPVPR
jgi:two-component system NtrC family sensor kinase